MHRIPLLKKGKREVLVSYYCSVNLELCDSESGKCKRVQVPGISCDRLQTQILQVVKVFRLICSANIFID